ncbi:MAG: class I SAM-dependent methyltransferase [Chloroflexi bacterium]|nr:class I SAM-dependent methyltransferase [Chloroflexota bacterium]MCI0579654.1 class I SAM-dependent methyltransferase [Chloroflexota bacterium]MCI0645906.1 class I SAM-dependent methyltransferase [Chloroflexota bacterium]MCI0725761.1 class I SAM-dependent methyltransferase [Chloroflexota bacterium]
MKGPKQDEKTVAYFDSCGARWSPGRYRYVIEMLSRRAGPDSNLIDIGCGSGNILNFLQARTPIQKLVGLDPSPAYLATVQEQLQCETILGSILDEAIVTQHTGRFDFAIMGDVLHHLVGNTRAVSRVYAGQAIANALRLVKESGYLLILEPLFRPGFVVTGIFYLKVLMTSLFPERLELFNKRWVNIGAPVVSFYNEAQLAQMIHQVAGATLMDVSITPLKGIGFGVRHGRMTLTIQKRP